MTMLTKQKTVFVDTGAFIAKYMAADSYHERAKALWARVRQELGFCVTTHFVLSELITFLVYKSGSANASRAAREIYATPFIQIHPITRELELSALDWMDKLSDKKISFTDATSFAFMSANKIKKTVTFDQHFSQAGFDIF